MRVTLILILILALPLGAYAEVYDVAKGVFFSLVIADTGLTLGLLENEAYMEANPLWRPIIDNHGLVLALDFGILIATNFVLDKIRGWRKWVAYVALTTLIVIQASVVHNNWRLANE